MKFLDLLQVGQQYYTFVDETMNNKSSSLCNSKSGGVGDSITASTLRRKLFDQETAGGEGDDVADDIALYQLPSHQQYPTKMPDTPGIYSTVSQVPVILYSVLKLRLFQRQRAR